MGDVDKDVMANKYDPWRAWSASLKMTHDATKEMFVQTSLFLIWPIHECFISYFNHISCKYKLHNKWHLFSQCYKSGYSDVLLTICLANCRRDVVKRTQSAGLAIVMSYSALKARRRQQPVNEIRRRIRESKIKWHYNHFCTSDSMVSI